MKCRWNQWLREAKIEHIKSYPYIITHYSSVQLSFADHICLSAGISNDFDTRINFLQMIRTNFIQIDLLLYLDNDLPYLFLA
jgi:hypothetical protein